MKMFFGHRLQTHRSQGAVLMMACFVALLMAGCGQKEQPTVLKSAEVIPAAVPETNTPEFVPPTPPVAVAANAEGSADLKALNHAYIVWIVQNHIRPKTFEEFVASSKISVPPPPAGKKYVIDKSGFINLVNQ
jgi:hypothetical protein